MTFKKLVKIAENAGYDLYYGWGQDYSQGEHGYHARKGTAGSYRRIATSREGCEEWVMSIRELDDEKEVEK